MDTGVRDLQFTRGDDYEHVFTFTDAAEPPNLLDLAGCTFAAQLRRYQDDPDAVDFTVDDSNVASGLLTLTLDAATTAPLGRTYAWDLQMTDTDAKVTTVLAGTVDVALDVTREGGS